VFSAVSVAAVFVLRRRQSTPSPFRTPGYPVTPLLFIALMLWMVVDGIVARPAIALAGRRRADRLGVYFAAARRSRGYNHGEHVMDNDKEGSSAELRLDKWLWAARFFKTRSLAQKACNAGHVKCNGLAAKPARAVRVEITLTC